MPGHGSRYDKLASWTRYAKNGGHLAVVLDGTIAVAKVREVCTYGNSQQCEVVKYTETGRVVGGAFGGGIGSQAAWGCGLLSITSGIGGLVCAILVGGTGAAIGGYAGGGAGEWSGEKAYEVITNE